MWYFTWLLGIGFAVLLAILNALWAEHEAGRGTRRAGLAAGGRLRAAARCALALADGLRRAAAAREWQPGRAPGRAAATGRLAR